jgi:hypothetical protein
MASIQDSFLWPASVEDSRSLIDAILSLERPKPNRPTPIRRILDAGATPTLGRRALGACAAVVLTIMATAVVGLSRVATSSQPHVSAGPSITQLSGPGRGADLLGLEP